MFPILRSIVCTWSVVISVKTCFHDLDSCPLARFKHPSDHITDLEMEPWRLWSEGGPGTRSFSLVVRESKEPIFQDAFSGEHFSWSGRGKDGTGMRDRISPQVFSDCPLHIN